jgi:acyl dehydratase
MYNDKLSLNKGKYFEEFCQGQEFITAGKTVTEADLIIYTGFSGDYNPLHVDEEFAKGTPYKGRIAQGFMGLALASGLYSRMGIFDGTIIAFAGIENWRFLRPIFINDTISVSLKVIDTRLTSKRDRGVVKFDVTILNQKQEALQQGVIAMLMAVKDQGGKGEGD